MEKYLDVAHDILNVAHEHPRIDMKAKEMKIKKQAHSNKRVHQILGLLDGNLFDFLQFFHYESGGALFATPASGPETSA